MTRLPVLLALAVTVSGCASAPVIRKQSFDFKSTALFKLPCDSPEVLAAKGGDKDPLETTDNACNSTHMLRMVENFMKVVEADEQKGIAGDTIEEVRAKGFSIFLPDGTKRRPNTRPLYGNDALGAVGMGVAPPPLQKPEDIKAYADFMAQLYAEEYYEKDVRLVTDRLCVNNRATLETGDERTFAILWRNGHVFKRVIKGGPVLNPKQERAFLLCPSSFIFDTVTGAGSKAATGLMPIP